MQFGIQFFPSVAPSEKSAQAYYRESLDLVEAADRLGFTHVRMVEHYFSRYGGYSPNPLLFLAAAAQRSKRARLVTGAVLPVFNNPLKLAGEIAMLDGISDGRLDVGLARAFLPHEFRRFGISPDESIARYREGIEQIDLLLREENVTHLGQFHTIKDTTTYPRPTQQPRPKFYVAATSTPDSFAYAGRMGYSVMTIPVGGSEKVNGLLSTYRNAWREAGHPGNGEVMIAFHMFTDEDGDRARRVADPHIVAYFQALADASAEWGQMQSKDYQDYDRMAKRLQGQTMESQLANGSAWIGNPAEVRAQIERLIGMYGQFEHASLQVNFHTISFADALRSMELFARDVMPAFATPPATVTA
jgi:alkanesulfonate monooxygenase SsuD/methylene tetrahydromethanopterin reductase-like flavin-dependent oxidoreductase (luciferase family)